MIGEYRPSNDPEFQLRLARIEPLRRRIEQFAHSSGALGTRASGVTINRLLDIVIAQNPNTTKAVEIFQQLVKNYGEKKKPFSSTVITADSLGYYFLCKDDQEVTETLSQLDRAFQTIEALLSEYVNEVLTVVIVSVSDAVRRTVIGPAQQDRIREYLLLQKKSKMEPQFVALIDRGIQEFMADHHVYYRSNR
jgi:hypothetical protein